MEAKQRTRTSALNVYFRWNACSARARATPAKLRLDRMHAHTDGSAAPLAHTHTATIATIITNVAPNKRPKYAERITNVRLFAASFDQLGEQGTKEKKLHEKPNKKAETIIMRRIFFAVTEPKSDDRSSECHLHISIGKQFSDKRQQTNRQPYGTTAAGC